MRIRFQEWSHDETKMADGCHIERRFGYKAAPYCPINEKKLKDEAKSQFTYCLISGSTLYLCKILKILKNNKC